MKIRRQLLVILLATVFSHSLACQAMAQSTKPTIVIVHGAWGGAWAFRKVDAELREKGYNVYRPN
jgi:dienelactone hydrolase